MHASIFNRERRRIERQAQGVAARERRALRHLVQRVGGAAIIEGKRIIGYRMRDGSVACSKVRYRSEDDARADLLRIAQLPNSGHKPIRAYHCPWCRGAHLTSRPA